VYFFFYVQCNSVRTFFKAKIICFLITKKGKMGNAQSEQKYEGICLIRDITGYPVTRNSDYTLTIDWDRTLDPTHAETYMEIAHSFTGTVKNFIKNIQREHPDYAYYQEQLVLAYGKEEGRANQNFFLIPASKKLLTDPSLRHKWKLYFAEIAHCYNSITWATLGKASLDCWKVLPVVLQRSNGLRDVIGNTVHFDPRTGLPEFDDVINVGKIHTYPGFHEYLSGFKLPDDVGKHVASYANDTPVDILHTFATFTRDVLLPRSATEDIRIPLVDKTQYDNVYKIILLPQNNAIRAIEAEVSSSPPASSSYGRQRRRGAWIIMSRDDFIEMYSKSKRVSKKEAAKKYDQCLKKISL
jgi:hypothetical protein